MYFFRNRRNHVGSGKRALDQSIEQIKININWRENNEDSVRQWNRNKIGNENSMF